MTQARSTGVLKTLMARAIASLLGGVVVAAAVAFWVFGPSFARTFTAELNKRGETMTRILAQHQVLRLALALKNARDATELAEQLVRGDGDIRYVIFLNSEGGVLAGAVSSGSSGAEALKHQAEKHLDKDRTDGSGDLLTFTYEVRREDQGQGDPMLPDEAPAGAAKPLGKILLGLSASTARAQLSTQTLATILVTATVLTLIFLVFFTRIARRVNGIKGFAAEIASGNLTAALKDQSTDEIGLLAGSLEEMAQKTGAMVGRLQSAAEALARGSSEILMSSTQQGVSANRQAAAVSETGATVAELRETFNQASERAQAVIELAKKAEESTTSGNLAVQQSVAAMEELRDQVAAISRTIVGLVERTTQIGAIIDAVNDLAEQSNVLALNAAIEAARAGEHGRGFAVVAREVRSLAERSKDSTGQVRGILQDIERASREALGVIEEGNRRAQSGLALATRAGESIVVLDRAINESSSAAKQIAASSRQQAVGVEQIWQAMKEIERVVNESASGIRQLEQASRNMNDLSNQMTGLVKQYRVVA